MIKLQSSEDDLIVGHELQFDVSKEFECDGSRIRVLSFTYKGLVYVNRRANKKIERRIYEREKNQSVQRQRDRA